MFSFNYFGYAKPFNVILKENSMNGSLLLGDYGAAVDTSALH